MYLFWLKNGLSSHVYLDITLICSLLFLY